MRWPSQVRWEKRDGSDMGLMRLGQHQECLLPGSPRAELVTYWRWKGSIRVPHVWLGEGRRAPLLHPHLSWDPKSPLPHPTAQHSYGAPGGGWVAGMPSPATSFSPGFGGGVKPQKPGETPPVHAHPSVHLVLCLAPFEAQSPPYAVWLCLPSVWKWPGCWCLPRAWSPAR